MPTSNCSLADKGTKMLPWDAIVDREAWRSVRGDGGLKENTKRATNGNIRTTITWREGSTHITQNIYRNECPGWDIMPDTPPWDTHNCTATRINPVVRIERATDAFGTLNILPKNNITWGDVQEAGIKAEEKLNDNLSGLLYTVGKERTTRASRKITDAVQHLRTERRRETLIRELDEEPTTCELDTPIDVETLKEFIAHPMSLARKTNGNKVNAGQNYRMLATQPLNKI
jgi:hypothetical protein